MKRVIASVLTAAFLCIACACTAQKTVGPPLPPPTSPAEEESVFSSTPFMTTLEMSKTESASSDTSPLPALTMTEEDMELFNGSYDILRSRITPRGYAITSLTGTYVGMFTRDSSIQALAHIACGDSDSARAILRYLLSCHAALSLKRAAHIVDELKDEPYGNDYLSGEGAVGPAGSSPVSQRNPETPLYRLNAPDNAAAAAFVAQSDVLSRVEVNLTKTGNGDTVKLSVTTDFRDPSSAICQTYYTFGTRPSGWQSIVFEKPVKVEKGKTYYIVLQAEKSSGNVVWNGTTGKSAALNSFNYDVPAFGGWVEKPYHPAFEVLPFAGGALCQSFTARAGAVTGVECGVFSCLAGGKVKAEVYEKKDGPASPLCRGEAPIGSSGEQTVTIGFDEALGVEEGKEYVLNVSFEDADPSARLLTDPVSAADSYALESGVKIGYALEANLRYDTDRVALMALEEGSAGIQEIPAKGETVTCVRALLMKEPGAQGAVKASLYKGTGREALLIDVKRVNVSEISENPDWVTFSFDLPLFKTTPGGSYTLRLETEGSIPQSKVFWCGKQGKGSLETRLLREGEEQVTEGCAGFEALRGVIRLVSDYEQADTTYMLIHAWARFVAHNPGAPEDLLFIEQSYPILKGFANYYLNAKYFDRNLNLILNPSLEHSRKGRYWIAYDLITNVFASQALHELSLYAQSAGDEEMQKKWALYASKIEKGISDHLVTEVDGKPIYGEFYDAEDGMKFYPGISWVNFAPVAAEWYAMDREIMQNTYEVYKKYASINMFGHTGLATDATLGTAEIRRELIGKGVAWELMFCGMTGNTDRIKEIMALEEATAQRYRLKTYPESWTSQSTVSDPGNQEHCSWQVYAVAVVFKEELGFS